jgi:hypothetical protein
MGARSKSTLSAHMPIRKLKDVDRDEDAHNHGSKHAASHDSRRTGRFQQRYLRHAQRTKIIELQHTRSKSALGLFVPPNAPTTRARQRGAVIVAAATGNHWLLDLAEAAFEPAQRLGPVRVRRKSSFGRQT